MRGEDGHLQAEERGPEHISSQPQKGPTLSTP